MFFFISQAGHSQNTIEMVRNGDFDKLNHYNIPIAKYKEYFREKLVPDTLGFYRLVGGVKHFMEYRLNDIYGITGEYFSRPINYFYGYDIHSWFYMCKSIQFLQDWLPYRNSKIKTVNFDSIVYQDTFHFYLRNQIEHYEIMDSFYFFDNAFWPTARKSKLRVCGQNLFNMTSKLAVSTKKGAYYVINLDLFYDYITHLNTMIFRKYFLNADATVDGIAQKLESQFPGIDIKGHLLAGAGSYPWVSYLERYCNITLDSNKFARNNNFKVTLLNHFFDPNIVKNKPLVSQDIWEMPLFSETNTEKHFEKRFKAANQLNLIQLNQREPGTVSYYPNDTVHLPSQKDSLIKLITFGGMYHEALWQDNCKAGFHPTLGHWKRLKQWQYPGKIQRYAQKVLRNADYFLDNLSLKPEMYQKGKIAAPNVLCHSDTFLAFLPSEENATWTDLKTGKIISQGDTCWIFLTDEVQIEVKTSTFVDTLYYKIQKPESPFKNTNYSICVNDTLHFETPINYSTKWQFGSIKSNKYQHLYSDTIALQAYITTQNGCSFSYEATVVKGPKLNHYEIDTFLCNQNEYFWNIPSSKWKFIAQNGAVKEGALLKFKTVSDFKNIVYLTDSATNCGIRLNVNILSSHKPNLAKDIDTTICYDGVFKYELSKAEWYLMNSQFTPNRLAISESGIYKIIAGNRTCADTQLIRLVKYPQIKVNIVQINPWTCYLDSQLIFKASPSKYKYYWEGRQFPDSLYVTQDSQQIQILVLDSHQCERNYTVFPLNRCFKPVWIPNVFTPNGNGPQINEMFQAQCASCKIIYMRIYSIWGEKIYEGVEPWDGTYQGQIVPNGVYAYAIGVKLNTGINFNIEHFKGSVQVLR